MPRCCSSALPVSDCRGPAGVSRSAGCSRAFAAIAATSSPRSQRGGKTARPTSPAAPRLRRAAGGDAPTTIASRLCKASSDWSVRRPRTAARRRPAALGRRSQETARHSDRRPTLSSASRIRDIVCLRPRRRRSPCYHRAIRCRSVWYGDDLRTRRDRRLAKMWRPRIRGAATGVERDIATAAPRSTTIAAAATARSARATAVRRQRGDASARTFARPRIHGARACRRRRVANAFAASRRELLALPHKRRARRPSGRRVAVRRRTCPETAHSWEAALDALRRVRTAPHRS